MHVLKLNSARIVAVQWEKRFYRYDRITILIAGAGSISVSGKRSLSAARYKKLCDAMDT